MAPSNGSTYLELFENPSVILNVESGGTTFCFTAQGWPRRRRARRADRVTHRFPGGGDNGAAML